MDMDTFIMIKKHQIRQKLIENIGFTLIRINPNVDSFDIDVEIPKIYNHINKSSVKLAVNSAKNRLKKILQKNCQCPSQAFLKL